ncbi:hypothetical protein CLOM_g16548, partial [Closterium sp. NIES-68]
QAYFNLTSITALNRGLNCSALKPNTAVCVERNPALAGYLPECSQWRSVSSADTCDSLRLSAKPPLSPLNFFRLNRDINCEKMAPAVNILGESSWSTGATGYFGFQVCLSSQASYGATCSQSGTTGKTIGYMTCTSILNQFFYGIDSFKPCNGYECPGALPSGTTICVPLGMWTPCL